MSRVAKKPIVIPAKVEISVKGNVVSAKGPAGQDTVVLNELVSISQKENELQISANDETKLSNALSGTMRALVANLIEGVTQGFERKLILVGVGYRAQVQGTHLNLTLGLSHPVKFDIPKGVKIDTPIQTEIVIKGINKNLVGQVAANIRKFRKPEPYKGKGIRYADEAIILKETKKK